MYIKIINTVIKTFSKSPGICNLFLFLSVHRVCTTIFCREFCLIKFFVFLLQPQNLVLTADYPNCDVKLCDFGISRYLSEGADVREILGTPDYVAPEVLNYEPIDVQTDMW